MSPWPYIKGASSGDFSDALQSLTDGSVDGLSANTVVQLKNKWSREFDVWSKRDLSSREFVYSWAAIRKIYPTTREQRCWFHKTGNVLNQMPKSVYGRAKYASHAIQMATTRATANSAFDLFLEKYDAKYPKACECLRRDRDVVELL